MVGIHMNADKYLDGIFDEVSKKNPDSVCLVEENQVVTFSDLNAKIEKYKSFLIYHKIKLPALIVIHYQKSVDLVAAILATLKLGSTYVPLDPKLSLFQKKNILSRINFDLILTDSALEIESSKCFFKWEVYETLYNSPDIKVTEKSAVAYVLHTSGSTGISKGVLGTHAGLINRKKWFQSQFLYSSQNIIGWRPSVGFIDCHTELFTALLTKTPLLIIPDYVLVDPLHFVQFLIENKVTHLTLVPSQAALITKAICLDSRFALSSIKYLFLSGETFSVSLAKELFKLFPLTKFVNIYGSTEVAGDVLFHIVTQQDLQQKEIPLGKAVFGNEVYILDKNLNEVSLGGEGEICVSGCQLALGYHDAALNKNFIEVLGKQIYKMGDNGKQREDGAILFRGRSDDEIKIAGQKVFLKDIDDKIYSLPFINEARSVVVEDALSNQKQIICYVSLKEGEAIDSKFEKTQEIMNYCRTELPVYMVPKQIIYLNRLPKLPSGKVDSKKLKCEFQNKNKSLCAIKIEEETFFDYLQRSMFDKLSEKLIILDSIQLALLSLELNKRYRVQVSVSELTQVKTIEDIYQIPFTEIRHRRLQDGSTVNKIFKSSFSQQRVFFETYASNIKTIYNLAHVYTLEGNVELEKLKRAIFHIYNKYDLLRASFEIDASGELICKINEPGTIPFEELEVEPEDVSKVLHEIVNCKFNFKTPPLIKFFLVMTSLESYFCCVAHHIILDGWSFNLLLSDLSQVYNDPAAPVGESVPFSEYIQSELDVYRYKRESQIKFWTHQLYNLPKMQPKISPNYEGAFFSFELEESLTDQINSFLQTHQMTSGIFFLTLFNLSVSNYKKMYFYPMAMVYDNRSNPDFIKTIGFLANTHFFILPERLIHSSYVQIFESSRMLIQEIQKNQHLPLQEILLLNRNAKLKNFLEFLFIQDNEIESSFNLNKIQSRKVELTPNGSKFNLTLSLKHNELITKLNFEYKNEIFTDKQVKMFLAIFIAHIKDCVKNPHSNFIHIKEQGGRFNPALVGLQ